MRRRHVPQRTCIGCGQTSGKRGLIRIVRTPGGQIEVDLTGKKPGRGAYLCRQAACWQQALSKGIVSRVLKTTIPEDAKEKLNDQLHLLRLEENFSGSEEPEQ